MKLKYKIIHIDKIDQRKSSVEKVRRIMEESGVSKINSEVADLYDFEQVDIFLKNNKNFIFNFHSEFPKPFPHISGVVGCWASHYLAWEKMVAENLDAIIVFEDDVYVEDDFMRYIDLYLSHLPSDWDFFSISIPPGEENRYNYDLHHIGDDAICKFYQAWNTGAYLVSRRGALKAIKDISKNGISVPIDWYIFESGRDKFNTYNPMPHIKKIIYFDEDFNNSYIGTTEERFYE